MSDAATSSEETQGVPPAFVAQVKQVLEHLYDFPYLQQHPLARPYGSGGKSAGETASQQLRRKIMAAIDALSPGPGSKFRTPQARLYNLLHLHYVEGGTIQEAANELGLSLRQAYRDLRRAEECVAATLWDHYASFDAPQTAPTPVLSEVQAEMDRLEDRREPIDLGSLLARSLRAVDRLAQHRAVRCAIDPRSTPVTVLAEPVVAQQLLTHLLSQVVQHAQPDAVTMLLRATDRHPFLELCYTPAVGSHFHPTSSEVIVRLADRLGWAIRDTVQHEGSHTVTLHKGKDGPTMLVIDDNEGLVQLLGRYLTGHMGRVVAATSGREGIRLAHELIPDVIILDIMMPEMDGWEVLQEIRLYAATAMIPVIICSVFNDPDLAYSLGASVVLAKPVTRDGILDALHTLTVL